MKKILYIEDNPSNRYMVRFLLEKSNFEIIEAQTGEEGIAEAESHMPDLIIVDIQLPDINGLEVTRRILSSRITENIPIVALTSYAMPDDRELALKAGCAGYLEKPIVPETFTRQIQEFLSAGTGAK